MKLFHLSDLHLGKRLGEVSLLEEQAYILTQIIQLVDEEKPDAILIAGDVYDKSMPPAEAVTLLDDFLSRLARRQLPVFMISGNHDSPERLSFGHRLMVGAGIYVAPVYRGQVEPITLTDAYGPVRFWLLPFLKPAHVRRYYPEAEISSYTDACRTAVEQMEINPGMRNVLLSHQFVTGAATCDSEEISVGGTDNVDAEIFADFDYVALGHIHGPQNIGSNRIRYCGTPLKYSFSEAGHYKSITVVELGQKGELHLQTLPLIPKHDLRTIRGTFAQLTDHGYYAGTATEDYLHITLTDEEDIPEVMGRLRVIYPNVLQVSYDNTRTRMNQQVEGAADVENKSQLELFAELYEQQNNQPMSQIQQEFVQKLIESIWEGEG